MIPLNPCLKNKGNGVWGETGVEMQKLTGRLGDSFGELVGPIGGKTYFPELSHLHNLPMGIMGNGVFLLLRGRS